jgi:putative toxin-antitoxin system antitoxin component (TIGR02293 family)
MASRFRHSSTRIDIAAIKAGLPFEAFEELAARLGVGASMLATTIRVSFRTLQRRKQAGAFRADESDRLYRIIRLTERASEVLGSSAEDWLTSPKQTLGGRTPLEFADTEVGAWETTPALRRLERGVFL